MNANKDSDSAADRFEPGASVMIDGHDWETVLLLASQMRAISQLHAAYTHDLKSPLNAIHLTIELLSDTLMRGSGDVSANNESDARLQRYVTVLRDEFTHLNRIINFMAAQTMPLSEIVSKEDVNDLVDEVTNVVMPQVRRQRASLNYRRVPTPILIHGCRAHLKQALVNLLMWSLGAISAKGELGIDVMENGKSVEITLKHNGGEVFALNRGDMTGIGNASSFLNIEFEAAQRVITSHGGTVVIGSNANLGYLLRVVLPLAI